ncbi:MAG: hypothetical protein JOZ65_15505 [Chloroflexi bacterium]|nr:hypothetical protein [Chloroflexota bacterium]
MLQFLASGGLASITLRTVEAASTPAYVQSNSGKSTSGTTVSAAFPVANAQGNTIVALVVWSNTGGVTVADSNGNGYHAAKSATPWKNGTWQAQVFYASNVRSGADNVTATFGTSLSGSGILYIQEYAGIDPLNPLDGTVSASGTSASMDSGPLTTTNATDLLIGAGASNNAVTQQGTGYTVRNSAYGNVVEDSNVSATGSYHATASQNGNQWVMQLLALRAATSAAAPTPVPAAATPTPAPTNAPPPAPAPPPPAPAPGGGTSLLHTSASNSHFLVDGNGRAVYLAGSHTWDDLQDTDQSSNPAPFDFNSYVNFLVGHGQNMTILWHKDLPTYCNWGAGGTWNMSPFPWPRSGGGSATDGKPKFDLSQFDSNYFSRLRARAVQLQQNGIYVAVQLFDGLGLIANRCSNDGFPLSGPNNINGIDDGGGTGSMTMGGPNAVTNVQDAYVRHVVDTLNDLPNVVWEVSEEAPSNSTWWQSHMISLLHSYEAGKPLQHVVGYPILTGGSDSTLYSSSADWVAPSAHIAPASNAGNKTIIDDSDHAYYGMWNDSPQTNRNWIWENFTNGASVLFMDPYEIYWSSGNRNICANPSNGVCNGVDHRWDNFRDNLGDAVSYANRMNLAAMTPQGGRSSTGYALANTASVGSEYLVYAPNGGSFTVNLSNTSRTFNVEWLNPSNRARVNGGTVAGGSSAQSFSPPFGGDAVLYLVDNGVQPGPPPVQPTATPVPPTPVPPTPVPPTPVPAVTSTPTTGGPGPKPAQPITFVQTNNAVPQSPQSTVSLTYLRGQTAGNTNVLAIGWNDVESSLVAVSDSQGNSYRVAAQIARGSDVSQAILYASNIRAGVNTVTVTFSAAVPFADVRIFEYSGISASNPVDGTSSAAGNGGTATSGNAAVTSSNDVLFGAGMTDWSFNGGGKGYTVRVITSPDADLAEDGVASGVGSAATAPVTGNWVMQAVAFRPGP